MKKNSCLLIAFLLSLQSQVFSAACLSNYLYRVPITLTNNDVASLNNFQVKVPINTQILVAAGSAERAVATAAGVLAPPITAGVIRSITSSDTP